MAKVEERLNLNLTENYNPSAIPCPRNSEVCHALSPLESHDAESILPGYKGKATKVTIPGEPWLNSDSSSPSLRSFIIAELLTSGLDKLSPHLWLVSTQKSDHISPLHAQLVKGRQITITENPELHLTWMHDHVYVKPLPECLMSWEFWNQCLNHEYKGAFHSAEECDLARASAMGFLRSYSHLILHPSDYRIAKESGLIPAYASYATIRRFLAHFRHIPDSATSKRYQFGELPLRRVNFWARFFLRRFLFQKVQVHYNYNAYFSRFYGPLLFIFAFFSVQR